MKGGREPGETTSDDDRVGDPFSPPVARKRVSERLLPQRRRE
jgi:hypothetical protein